MTDVEAKGPSFLIMEQWLRVVWPCPFHDGVEVQVRKTEDERDEGVTIIRDYVAYVDIDARLDESAQMSALLHEWAHVLTMSFLSRLGLDFHDDIFYVMLGRLERAWAKQAPRLLKFLEDADEESAHEEGDDND